MAATIIIDIIHSHAEEPDGEDKMIVMARGMIDPDATCEHEMLIMGLFVQKISEIQQEVIIQAAQAFIDEGMPLQDQKEDTGETLH